MEEPEKSALEGAKDEGAEPVRETSQPLEETPRVPQVLPSTRPDAPLPVPSIAPLDAPLDVFESARAAIESTRPRTVEPEHPEPPRAPAAAPVSALGSPPDSVGEAPPDTVVDPVTEQLAAAERFVAVDPAPVRKDSARPVSKSSAKVQVAAASEGSLAVEARPLAAYELLARSARLGDIVALTSRIVSDAAASRSSSWGFTSAVSTGAAEAKLSRSDADTRFGNAIDVLGSGGEGEAERALASALWAHAVAEAPRARAEDEDRLAGDVLWLATHTAFDATPLLDRALGDEAAELWNAIADRVRRIERGNGGALGRGEAVVGCAALAASASDRAKTLCETLAKQVKDPVLLRVLGTGAHAAPDEVRLEGELLPTPRGPIATTLLAFTGILLLVHAVRLIARVALAYRRPAEVSLTESGVRVKTRTELLGRILREREHVIPRTGLVRVVREVRFPRAAFYAGLLALAVGSWIGVRAFVDGVRAASPSLLVVGLVIVALGIAADFVLGTLIPGARGRVRVAFVPRKGPVLCVGDVDPARADDALTRSLARR